MARAVAEIERDILALSTVEKEALLDVLISELDVPGDEQFDEEIRRIQTETRAAVLKSGESWPFAGVFPPPLAAES